MLVSRQDGMHQVNGFPDVWLRFLAQARKNHHNITQGITVFVDGRGAFPQRLIGMIDAEPRMARQIHCLPPEIIQEYRRCNA